MSSNPDSKKPSPPPSKSPANCARFLAAQLMMVIYWPSCVILIILTCIYSSAIHTREAHHILGQLIIRKTLSGFIQLLEWIGIVHIHDQDLTNLPDTPAPLILASNHPALWDAPLIIRRIPRLSGIMKAELLNNPLLQHGAHFAGFLPNSPRMTMIRASLKRLSTGGRLLFFPEGTRTRPENGPLNPFRPGLALIAKESRLPITPIFIHQNNPYLRKGWPIIKMPHLPITITIRLGQPIHHLPHESAREFSTRLEHIFRQQLT